MATPSVMILRSPGTNCDEETAFAFEQAGAITERVHINRLREEPKLLERFQILALPGGFSYGDDCSAGKILAIQMQLFLQDELRKFRDKEKLILGICNGFQVLLKAGLIMPPDEDGPLITLTSNDSGRYDDRWVHLQVQGTKCPFLNDYTQFYLPVAHGEGKVLCREQWILQGLQTSGQAVLTYCDANGQPGGYPINPNGSDGHIAGLCDATGRVFGLMPHPERHILPTHHPKWTREGLKSEGDGLKMFRNAVEFFRS